MDKIVNIALGNQLVLDKLELDDDTISHIKKILTLNNPKYIDAEKYGRYLGNLDQYIYAYDEDKDYLCCLRGFLGSFLQLLAKQGYQYSLIDNRRKLDDIELVFRGEPRQYQQRAITESLKKHFCVLVAPCGSGKTVMACAIIAERRQPTLVIVHTKELLNQWVERIGQYLEISSDEVGVIGGGKQIIRRVTVGMVQTLRKRNLFDIREHFGQIIVDECFVAGTIVDRKPIESLNVGDYVMSWDEKEKQFVNARILRIFKRLVPNKLIKIKAQGTEIVCTLNHLILVNNSWKQAFQVKPEDILIKRKNNETKKNNDEKLSIYLHGVSKNIRKQYKNKKRLFSSNRQGVLFNRVWEGCQIKNELKNNDSYQSKICIKKNERKKSNVRSKNKSKDGSYAQKNRAQAAYTRREWKRNTYSSKNINGYTGRGMGIRIYNYNRGSEWRKIFSESLQNRSSQRRNKNSNRNRRIFSLFSKKTRTGFKKDNIFESLRVDSIEIYEQGGNRGFKQLCPNGYVYNLEIEKTNTYTANGIVVHNCHHIPSVTFTDVVSAVDSYYMLGLSATPYRCDKLDKLIFVSLGNISATVKDSELQEAGLKINPLIIVRETKFDFDYLNDSKGKLSDEQYIVLYRLSQSLDNKELSSDAIKNINSKINSIIYQPMISALVEDEDRNQLIADDIVREARFGNSILLLSDRKLHLTGLETLLREQEIECAVLTADVPKTKREQIIHDFDSGILRIVLAIGSLAGEGLDIPRINRLFITTPIKWKGRITQYVGRALRPAKDKHNTKIYDYVDLPVILKSSYWARMREYKKLGGVRC